MEKVLFISSIFILPPTSGGRECIYQRITLLSKFISIKTIIMPKKSNINNNEDLINEWIPKKIKVRFLINDIKGIKKSGIFTKIYEGIKWFISGEPRAAQIFISDENKKIVMDTIISEKINYVCIEGPYVWNLLDRNEIEKYGIKIIYVAHNVEYLYWKEINYEAGLGLITQIDLNRIKRFEKKVVNNADLVIGISPKDISYMKKYMNPKKAIYLPTNLELKQYSWVDRNSNYICFTGSLSFYPNYHGMKWFLENIFNKYNKLYPNIKLKITGKVSESIRKEFSKYSNVIFTGFLSNEELENLMLNSLFSVVPIIKGSGVKIKLLEALLYGIPVVTTQHGADGVPYEKEKPYLIGKTAKDFLEQMICLTKNKEIRKDIGYNARSFAEKTYTSEYNAKKWIDVITKCD